MADPHQFEQDLRAIREARGVDLAAVQQETRIPADVLDRFETGRLVGDLHYNEVYLRNLVRAYASAIGLPPQQVLSAYEAVKQDTYAGQLRRYLGGEAPAPKPPPPPTEDERPADERPGKGAAAGKSGAEQAVPEAPAEKAADAPPRRADAAAAPPAVAALKAAKGPSSSAPPPKHEPKVRVRSRESVTSSTSGIESSWGIIIAGTLVAILVIGGALWLMIRPDPDEVVQPVNEAVVVQEEEAEEPDEAAPPPDAPRLEMPIQVTLIAEDGPLGGADGFRVTEVPDVRRPYWLEQGEEQTFSSDSLVILWGTETAGQFGIPAEARLRMQGYTWDPPTGSVLEIDRRRGQALLDSLHRVR